MHDSGARTQSAMVLGRKLSRYVSGLQSSCWARIMLSSALTLGTRYAEQCTNRHVGCTTLPAQALHSLEGAWAHEAPMREEPPSWQQLVALQLRPLHHNREASSEGHAWAAGKGGRRVCNVWASQVIAQQLACRQLSGRALCSARSLVGRAEYHTSLSCANAAKAQQRALQAAA